MNHHPQVFLVPGLYNSGPQHWQTHWENQYGYTRIVQDEWDKPVRANWVDRIQSVTASVTDQELVLVCHSLACCTIAHWAAAYPRKIKGALLVGPSDVDAPSYPEGTTGFMPMPLQKLPFPSLVIASTNDEYVTVERAKEFSNAWDSDLVFIGEAGHINSASNLGNWPEGWKYLQQILNS